MPSPSAPPLTVSPKTVDLLVPKSRKAIQEIFVHNPNSVAYYDVWVKVTIDSHSIKAEKINIQRVDAKPINLASDHCNEASG